MVALRDIVAFCDRRTSRAEFADFPGACNGLQVENRGTVSRIGAAVDAGLVPFEEAVRRKIDFLICHHGLFWHPPIPLTGHAFQKTRTAIEGNLAVYGSHLPLDAHPEIGNNAILCRELGLEPVKTFLEYEGKNIGMIARVPSGFAAVRQRMRELFPGMLKPIEFGMQDPKEVAVLTGSGQSAVDHLKAAGVDTLITGELRQHHFNLAQECRFNLYSCGHYATEVFGVQALASEAAAEFGLDWEFISTDCPL